MKIILFRHGHAEPKAATDGERPLSKRGRKDVEDNANRNRDHLQDIDTILVSPYLRAQQTLEQAQPYLPDVEATTDPGVLPEAGVEAAIAKLEKLRIEGSKTVLVVTHQPFVGDLVNELCGAAYNQYPMDTATLICIETDVCAAGCGTVQWLSHA